jgi:Protein of unknown function (DUF1200).
MKKRKFRSRVSVVLLVFIFLCCFGIFSFIPSTPPLSLIITICSSFAFSMFILFTINYTIEGDVLITKCCGQSITINIHEIESIKRSYNPLSSPASSLKRLCVNKTIHKWSYTLISPVREEEFLAILKEINPNIIIEVNDKKSAFRFWDWDI